MDGVETQDAYGEINSPEFLARLRAADAAAGRAFARLVQVTHDRFLGFIRRQLSDSEECREVLQEVYLAAHKALHSFEGKSKLTTWMYSLAHHKICDRIADRDRKHAELTEAHQESLSTETKRPEGWAGISPWDSASDRVAARNAVEALIAKAVEALPENARQVYHLRDVEELSGEETAAILGITPENVRVQLHRARRSIVDWVQDKLAQASKGK